MREKVVELDPDSSGDASQLVFQYAEIGAFDEAEAAHRRMEEKFGQRDLALAVGPALAFAQGKEIDLRAAVSAGLEDELSSQAAFVLGYSAMLGNEFDLAYDGFRRSYPGDLENATITPDFMNWWLGSLCELSWVMLETEGNEIFGRELLRASIDLYENGFHPEMQGIERFNWSLCYLLTEDNGKALELLDRELEQSFTGNWRWLLRATPYDAVRNDPRFVVLWTRFEERASKHLELLRKMNRPTFEF